MNEVYKAKINEHYGKVSILDSILEKLKINKIDPDNLTRKDLETFEDFHIGGKLATHHLAEFANFPKGAKVLDIGCGIGGPARTLAEDYGCKVVGVDLTEAYVHAATQLTSMLRMEDKVSFSQGDATGTLPFESKEFDYVWLQHVTMNIEDKKNLFKEVHRLLKDDGKLVFYEIIKGNDQPIAYPVFWSPTDELSFLVNKNSYKSALEDAGLVEQVWEDKSQFASDWFQKMLDNMKASGPPKLGLKVIIADDVPIKAKNILDGINEGKLQVVRAIYTVK